MTNVIITCAPTGSIHTPSMSPHLPVTPEEIAEAAIQAVAAGAAIVHLHARDATTGKPTQDPAVFAEFLPVISAASDVVVNITTGGSPHMSLDERLQPVMKFAPEIASLNMGSMNFGLFPMLDRYPEFKHSWEREHLGNSRDLVFKNTFADIERILSTCRDMGTRFEFECYDVSHLYNLAHFLERGLVEPPLFVQTVMGILGGIGPDPEDLMHMRRTAQRLFGSDWAWSVLGAGAHQIRLTTMGLTLGSHVRVGLEDSLWDGPGTLAESNADQVRRIRALAELLHHEIATPDEARSLLGLKGRA